MTPYGYVIRTLLQFRWFHTIEARVHQWVRERAVESVSCDDFEEKVLSFSRARGAPIWTSDPTGAYRVVVGLWGRCTHITVLVVSTASIYASFNMPTTLEYAYRDSPNKGVHYALKRYLEGLTWTTTSTTSAPE